MKKIIKTGLFIVGLCFMSSALAANEWISVLDGLAGENVPVRVAGLQSEERFSVELFRPDKSIINFEQLADEFGNSSFDIYGLHVRLAGNYELRIKRDFGNASDWRRHFRIFPGPVSAYQSEINIEMPSVPADGKQASLFTITLKDAFGNPVSGRNIKVFSTRNEDDIRLAGTESNAEGQIQGQIQSEVPGVSVISVLTGEVLIFKKPEVVFHLAESPMENVGANSGLGGFLKAQLFDENATESVSYFEITGLETEAMVDDNLTITVVAKDENGEVVKNYMGTVRFSTSDNRANLPADYTFKEEDQGEHPFFLAVTFSTPGMQTISVHDLDNLEIASEEQSVQVISSTDPTVVPPKEKMITMLTPTPGSVKTDRVTVSGEVAGCNNIRIMDGSIVITEDLKPDDTGSYVYRTPRLQDGTHRFQAVCADDESLKTEKVSITVDRSPPLVVTVEIEPQGILPINTEFIVKVSADEALSQVQCVFNEVLTELDQENNIFVGTFLTPNQEGTYPLNCTVADLLGNEKQEPEAGSIQVGTAEPGNGDDHSAPVQPPPEIKPTAISNLQAKTKEGETERIYLTWSPAVSEKPITSYRINYNECGNELSFVNETPDNRTNWYIDHLIPCQKYCFKVTAIDETGEASVASNEVEGSPLCPEVQQRQQTGDTAPSAGTPFQKLWMPFLAAFFIGIMVLSFVRNKE